MTPAEPPLQEPAGPPERLAGWRDIRTLWTWAARPPERARLLRRIAAIVVVIGANTWGQVRLNTWQGAFFDSIGRRDLPTFVHELVVFAGLVSFLLVLVVLQTWLGEHIKVRLRGILTHAMLVEWLAPRRTYLLQYLGLAGEHPDQRVHEDARHLAELASDLGIGLVQASLLLLSFVGVLWQLSSDMHIVVHGQTLTIPGFMVWFALAYSLGGSLLTSQVGRPLVALNAERYAREADLRVALVRIDEGAQNIALDRREEEELGQSRLAFEAVQDAGRRLADALARLTFITSAYGWGTLVAPVIAAMPAYFSWSLSLGGLMMVVGAFGQVQQALRWFVDNFSKIADGRATLGRVVALCDALRGLSRPQGGPHIVVETGRADALSIEGLRLEMPDGVSVLSDDPLVVRPGDHVLVEGLPGSGKSLLFLALAGLWSQGEGLIRLPAQGAVTFLPERPHLARAALRDVLIPPGSGIADADLLAALERLGLGHLGPYLDRVARWDRDLHFDEQQGVALVHLLLQKPRWVVMDAALSAFRDERRKALLAQLSEALPQTGFVGTGLPGDVNGFWARTVTLSRLARPDGESWPPPVWRKGKRPLSWRRRP